MDHNTPPALPPLQPQVGKPFDPTCPTVMVKVGMPPTTFTVHQDVLQRSSVFLQTKGKEQWSKSGSTVDMLDQSEAAFKVYVNWLYTDKILLDCRVTDPNTADDPSHKLLRKSEEWNILAKSYVLGEELIDGAFQSSIMASFQAMTSSARSHLIASNIAEIISIIYGGTPETSAARSFFTLLYSERLSKNELKTRRDAFPADFVFDVLVHKAPDTAAGAGPQHA